jgi:hypothetical protein
MVESITLSYGVASVDACEASAVLGVFLLSLAAAVISALALLGVALGAGWSATPWGVGLAVAAAAFLLSRQRMRTLG